MDFWLVLRSLIRPIKRRTFSRFSPFSRALIWTFVFGQVHMSLSMRPLFIIEFWCFLASIFLSPMLSVGQQPTTALYSSSLLVQEGFLSGGNWIEKKKECLNWINWLISHNSSGHAFSSWLSIFPYAMMEMEYLGSVEFSNYGTNWFHTGGRTYGARTPTVWKISWEKVLAPVYPICTLVSKKYPNGVRPSTYWEKGGKSLFSLVLEK